MLTDLNPHQYAILYTAGRSPMEHPSAVVLHLSLLKIRFLWAPLIFWVLINPCPPRLPRLGGPGSRSCGQKGEKWDNSGME